jgi:hypothetical protein
MIAEVKLNSRHVNFASIFNEFEKDPNIEAVIENEFKFIKLYIERLNYFKKFKSDIKIKSFEKINNYFTSEVNNELNKAATDVGPIVAVINQDNNSSRVSEPIADTSSSASEPIADTSNNIFYDAGSFFGF